MIPRFPLIAAFALPALAAAVAIVHPAGGAALLAANVLVAVIALIDAWRSPASIDVHRGVEPIQSIGRAFSVAVNVHNQTRRPLRLRVTDAAPGDTEGLPAETDLDAGGRWSTTYRVTVDRRGAHAFGPITIRWRSPWALWERERFFPMDNAVRVYPDLLPLRTLMRSGAAGERRAPVRARRRPGGENEFERLRPYVPGDTMRAIDWRATARRGEPVTREYRQEVNQNLIFLLDAGRQASARHGRLTHFDHALNSALILSHVALTHGDRVGMLVYDSRIRAWLPPRSGRNHGPRLTQETYDLFPSWEETDHAAAFRFLGQRVRRRSLVVVLTSVLDDVNASMVEALAKGLAGRHVPLCAWQRDPALMRLLGTGEGPYIAAAAAELLSWRAEALRRLRSRGALVIDAEPERMTEALVGRYLQIKADRLL